MKHNNARWISLGALGMLAGLGIASQLNEHPLTDDPTMVYIKHGFVRRDLITPVGRMAYYERGNGQPLLFLHGIGGGASSWTWNKVATAFKEQYRVIIPDFVGWGRSEHPARLLLLEDYMAELEVLLQHIGQPCTIVAQGLSAGVAAALSRKLPELVAGLVLCSPAGGNDLSEDQFTAFFRIVFEPIARTYPINMIFYRLVFHNYDFIKRWFTISGFYDKQAVTNEIVKGYLYSARQPNGAYAALPFLSGELRFDMAPFLREVKGAAVIVWGDHETQIQPRVQAGLAAANVTIPVVKINRARTNFELEHPAQTIAVIEQFLASINANKTMVST